MKFYSRRPGEMKQTTQTVEVAGYKYRIGPGDPPFLPPTEAAKIIRRQLADRWAGSYSVKILRFATETRLIVVGSGDAPNWEDARLLIQELRQFNSGEIILAGVGLVMAPFNVISYNGSTTLPLEMKETG